MIKLFKEKNFLGFIITIIIDICIICVLEKFGYHIWFYKCSCGFLESYFNLLFRVGDITLLKFLKALLLAIISLASCLIYIRFLFVLVPQKMKGLKND